MKLKNTLWRLGDVAFVGELPLTRKRFKTICRVPEGIMRFDFNVKLNNRVK
jgi:hypothetical protein